MVRDCCIKEGIAVSEQVANDLCFTYTNIICMQDL